MFYVKRHSSADFTVRYAHIGSQQFSPFEAYMDSISKTGLVKFSIFNKYMHKVIGFNKI